MFDLKPETDVYWCTADVGWITGHSYVVYGPLINGATQVIYEGTPDTPHRGRWWEIIEKYKVSILYTAPTAIRTCMKWGEEIPGEFDLSSPARPRLGGRAHQPRGVDVVPPGHRRRQDARSSTPGGRPRPARIMISPLPGRHRDQARLRAGAAARHRGGRRGRRGEPVPDGGGGYLVLTEPWPSMLRGIWGDPERYKDTYWSRFEDLYFAGDGAKKDEDGDIWLLGRVDDVMNVSGHRLSTTEIESALVSPPVGRGGRRRRRRRRDHRPGRRRVRDPARATPGGGDQDADAVQTELRNHVAKEIGPIAKPRQILVVAELPKTRSGKIMRRLLRDVAEDRQVGDATTLADSSVMDLIAQGLSAPGAKQED